MDRVIEEIAASDEWGSRRIRALCQHLSPLNGQSQLARLMEVELSTVHRWITGKATPRVKMQGKLGRVAQEAGFKK